MNCKVPRTNLNHCVVDGHAGRRIYDIRHDSQHTAAETAAARYVEECGKGARRLVLTIGVGSMPNEHGKTMYPPSILRVGFDRAGVPRWINDAGLIPLLRLPLDAIDPVVRALRGKADGSLNWLADHVEQAPIVGHAALVAMTTDNCARVQKWLSSHRVVGKLGELFRPGIVEPPAAEDDAPAYKAGR